MCPGKAGQPHPLHVLEDPVLDISLEGVHHEKAELDGAARCDLDGKVTGTTELGGKKVMMRLPASAWDGKGYLVINWLEGNPRKIAALGWEPQVSFEEGVAKVVADIEYWRDAPLWDADSIAKATTKAEIVLT